MSDDIGKINIPRRAKRYARMKGIGFTKGSRKFDLHSQVMADLTNQKLGKFKNKDAVGKVKWVSKESLSPAQLVTRLLSEGYDEEVVAIIKELTDAGLHVENESQAVMISFEPNPDGEAVELSSGERQDIKVSSPDDENNATYDVFPEKDWEAFVKRCEAGDEPDVSAEDWVSISEEGGDTFESIIRSHGYELGSVGGHPPNFDYSKDYDGMQVTFCYWGNPFHC